MGLTEAVRIYRYYREAFYGHAGRPGMRGGSAPKGGTVSGGSGSAERKGTAETILNQLGGRQFLAMTGAKNLGFGAKGELTFKVPSGKFNHVKVERNDRDLYTVTFHKLRNKEGVPTVIATKTVEDVPAENLADVFTRATGLETRL